MHVPYQPMINASFTKGKYSRMNAPWRAMVRVLGCSKLGWLGFACAPVNSISCALQALATITCCTWCVESHQGTRRGEQATFHGSSSLLASWVPHVMLKPGWLAATTAAPQVLRLPLQQQHQQQQQMQLLEAVQQQLVAFQVSG
jgi:hypothetical protein